MKMRSKKGAEIAKKPNNRAHLPSERGRRSVLDLLPRRVFVVDKAARGRDALVQPVLLEHAAQRGLPDRHVDLGRQLRTEGTRSDRPKLRTEYLKVNRDLRMSLLALS